MEVTYSKQYQEQQAVNFTFFSDFSHKTPNVFWQYKDLLTFCFFATKEEIKQTETSKDSSVTETQTEATEKINLSTFLSEFNLEPIDNTKPFFVGAQKFENVKVNQKTEQKDFTQDITFLQNQTH